jgi:hypothetical protein
VVGGGFPESIARTGSRRELFLDSYVALGPLLEGFVGTVGDES